MYGMTRIFGAICVHVRRNRKGWFSEHITSNIILLVHIEINVHRRRVDRTGLALLPTYTKACKHRIYMHRKCMHVGCLPMIGKVQTVTFPIMGMAPVCSKTDDDIIGAQRLHVQACSLSTHTDCNRHNVIFRRLMCSVFSV